MNLGFNSSNNSILLSWVRVCTDATCTNFSRFLFLPLLMMPWSMSYKCRCSLIWSINSLRWASIRILVPLTSVRSLIIDVKRTVLPVPVGNCSITLKKEFHFLKISLLLNCWYGRSIVSTDAAYFLLNSLHFLLIGLCSLSQSINDSASISLTLSAQSIITSSAGSLPKMTQVMFSDSFFIVRPPFSFI